VRNEAIKFVGPEIEERLEDYWELDDEGELRGVYKPMGGWFNPCLLASISVTDYEFNPQSPAFGILVVGSLMRGFIRDF
jgi:hypothetical protein